MPINEEPFVAFQDSLDGTPVLRPLTFDEATLVASSISSVAGLGHRDPHPFNIWDILADLNRILNIPTMMGYIRPVYEFVQRAVSIGILVELPLTTTEALGNLLDRRYRAGIAQTHEEWVSKEMAAAILGLPYVAHKYREKVVRVHSVNSNGDPGIGSGIVLSPGLVVTNRHVIEYVQNAEQISISWKDSILVPAQAFKVHPNPSIDLAVIAVDDFARGEGCWIRDPRAAEEIVVLAYPYIPQVEKRPLLSFTGTVASGEYVSTYWGNEQTIICSVMGPGASGGPVFGRDGRLVGLVVEMLHGKNITDSGEILHSIFHAIIPSGVLLRELKTLHPRFKFINKFGHPQEAEDAIAAWEDKWWEAS